MHIIGIAFPWAMAKVVEAGFRRPGSILVLKKVEARRLSDGNFRELETRLYREITSSGLLAVPPKWILRLKSESKTVIIE